MKHLVPIIILGFMPLFAAAFYQADTTSNADSAAKIASTPATNKSEADTKTFVVVKPASNKDFIFQGDYISVLVNEHQYDTLASKDSIFLWINNVPLKTIPLINRNKSKKQFLFKLDKQGIDQIFNLIHEPFCSFSLVKIGIGDVAGHSLHYGKDSKIRFYYPLAMGISIILVLIIIFWLAYLIKATPIIKDHLKVQRVEADNNAEEVSEKTAPKRPYSLSKSQFAFWTVIIISSYIILSISKGSFAEFTTSTLILLGISVTTAAAGNLIDKTEILNDKITKRHQDDPKDVNFIRNILSDETGVSIHRFQNVVFNLIFGLFFIYECFVNYKMPEFDTQLLMLMGISAGAYTGLKLEENKPPAS